MNKRYKVKDIYELTGLTRKQLFDYEKSIPPIERVGRAGYKLYDQEGLDKLSMAALFAELGAGPQRINDIFGSKKYDRTKVIDNLLEEAKRERQRLDDIITVAQELKKLELTVPFSPFQILDLHDMAEDIRNNLNSDDTQKLINMEHPELQKLIHHFSDISEITLTDEGLSSKDATKIEKLISFIRKSISDDNWARILTALCVHLTSVPLYKEYIDKEIGTGNAQHVGETIAVYQAEKVINETENSIIEANSILRKKHSSPEVRDWVYRIRDSIKKWYGIESLKETVSILQGIKYTMLTDEESDDYIEVWDLMIKAFQYYSAEED